MPTRAGRAGASCSGLSAFPDHEHRIRSRLNLQYASDEPDHFVFQGRGGQGVKRLVAYPGRQAGVCQFIARRMGQADMFHCTQFHKINLLTGSAPEYQRWHAVFVCQGKYVIAAANQQGAQQASEVQIGRVGFVVGPLDGKMLGIEAEPLQFAVDLGGHADEFFSVVIDGGCHMPACSAGRHTQVPWEMAVVSTDAGLPEC